MPPTKTPTKPSGTPLDPATECQANNLGSAVRKALRCRQVISASVVAAALAAPCPAAWAEDFPAVLELSALDGSNGFVLNGIDARAYSGFSVSSAGDINGDGIDDMIVGAWGAYSTGYSSGARNVKRGGRAEGVSYVVFGSAAPFSAALELSALDGSNGFVLHGIGVSDYSGRSVSEAGDINGDGIGDLIVGAPGAGSYGAGEGYVVFGSMAPFAAALELSALDGSNGFVLNPPVDSFQIGGAMSAAGDINGDGIGDLIVGDSRANPNGNSGAGASYVVFGSAVPFAAALDLSALDGSNGFVLNGINANDQSGGAVSAAGDVNGDGIDDVIVGARRAGVSNAGVSYVVFGSTTPFGAALELSALDGSNGFALNGIVGNDYSGRSVSAAGDINGDGIGDLIVGAPYAYSNGESWGARNVKRGTLAQGASYVVFGSMASFAALELSALDGSNGFVLNGIDALDRVGYSVSEAGDINGDGIGDLIVGASGAGVSNAGQSYVVFGSRAPFAAVLEPSALDGSKGFVLNGIDDGDNSGSSVSAAGDVNGDGIGDVIVGAFRADPNGNNSAGESYVVFGRAVDTDADGVPDIDDAFPLDPTETMDSDGDGVGDNADAFPNDASETADADGDGVGDNADAFPNDASETADSDGDGVGDNADAFPNDASETADADGDGVGDNADAFPNDASETADADGDGVGDNADAFPNDASETADSDGDGVGDNADVFPLDAGETADADGDGVGNNADAFPNDAGETADSDGDGVGDNADAFPNNAGETVDSDGDGVGNNADVFPNDAGETADADTDGVGDNADAFPNDASETLDSDGDGVGDNADAFPNDPSASAPPPAPTPAPPSSGGGGGGSTGLLSLIAVAVAMLRRRFRR